MCNGTGRAPFLQLRGGSCVARRLEQPKEALKGFIRLDLRGAGGGRGCFFFISARISQDQFPQNMFQNSNLLAIHISLYHINSPIVWG